MSLPILITKITVPAYRANMVLRPRLIDRLEQGLIQGSRLLLLSAPAGSGKSLLLAEWIASSKSPAPANDPEQLRYAWLSIEELDNDGNRFWLYFIHALQAAIPGIGNDEIQALSLAQPLPVQDILVSLINHIAQQPGKVVLVLDDYHLIRNDQIHDGIAFFLEHIPTSFHLVIASRADPPLPLNRLRVYNYLTEIRASELFFTKEEANALFNDKLRLDLHPQEIGTIENLTEGWAAGLQLAAIAIQEEKRRQRQLYPAQDPLPEQAKFIRLLSGNQKVILDYLVDEILNRQPVQVVRFLLYISSLTRFCPRLCDAVLTGTDVFGSTSDQNNSTTYTHSDQFLNYVDHENLFLIPLDDQSEWFRLHHLFAEALQNRLRQTQPIMIDTILERASLWCDENEYPEEAIHYGMKAGETRQTAAIIEKHAERFIQNGMVIPLSRWIEQIPLTVRKDHPGLCIHHARALVTAGQLKEAENQLTIAEQTVATFPIKEKNTLIGRIAAIRATTAILRADAPEARKQARKALELLPEDDPNRASAFLGMGDASIMLGEISLAVGTLREAISLGIKNNILGFALTASAHLTEALLMQGRLSEVEKVCSEAFDYVQAKLGSTNWTLPNLALIYTSAGAVKRERNQLTQAEQDLELALQIAGKGGYLTAQFNALAGLATIYRSQGNMKAAMGTIEQAFACIHGQEAGIFLHAVQALQAELWIRTGNLSSASEWAQKQQLDENRAVDYLGDYELYSLARLRLAEGNFRSAIIITDRLYQAANSEGRNGRCIEILVLQSNIFFTAEEKDQALDKLKQAIQLAAPENFVRVFLDEGRSIYTLLDQIKSHAGPVADYANYLLSQIPSAEKGSLPTAESLPEQLTSREMEVLIQMSAGASNQEIASNLILSIGTVKAHISHIMGKLGAQNRTQAVVIARDLGLLEK